MTLPLFQYQADAADVMERRDRFGLHDEMGIGKEQPVTCRVATPWGWRTLGSIRVGDFVFAVDGTPTQVIGVFPQGVKPCYRVTFRDGFSTECGLEHLWVVRDDNRKTRGTGWTVKPLSELISRGVLDSRSGSGKWEIPLAEPIEYAYQDLPVPPYTLGALIGDGSTLGNSLILSNPDMDISVSQRIAAELPEGYDLIRDDYAPCPRYTVKSRDPSVNRLYRAVGEMGLQCLSKDKFIPPSYLLSGIRQRRNLLEGLMDTDGSCAENRTMFHTISHTLAYSVAELVQSLGGVAIVHSYDRSAEGKLTEYHVNVKTTFCPFSTPRKAANWRIPVKGGVPQRRIVSVERIADTEQVCISVEHPKRMYATDHYIITHNTATSIGTINRLLATRGIIVAPAMLRENWLKEWRKFSTYDLRVCKGRNVHDFIAWSRGRFDILIASYELMTKWTPEFKRSGEYIDFIIFDEAHYLKNTDANRTRALLGHEAGGEDSLIEYAEHCYHVTGTPMANDPMDVYTFLRFAKAIDLPPDEFVKYFFEKRMGTFSVRHFVKPHMVEVLQQLISNNSIRRTHSQVGMELPPIWLKEVIIEGDTSEIAEAIKDYPHLEQMIVYAIEMGDLGLLDAPHIATLRRLVGKAKAVAYAQMLKWELDSGAGKRVCFFVHTEPLLYVQKYLKKYGYNMVIAYGDTPERERQIAVESYMNDPNVHVIGGNIKVMGVGLTLTVGTEIDVVESSWSPSDNAQAIKRVHRYGQRHEVHARFITLANSIDEAVNRVVAQKTASIAEIEGFSMAAAPLDVLAKAS